jgi:hypothetical protein
LTARTDWKSVDAMTTNEHLTWKQIRERYPQQ